MQALLSVALAIMLVTAAQEERYVPDTERVFGEGTIVDVHIRGGRTITFTLHQQPTLDLELPTGSIVANDAFLVIDPRPLLRTVEPGHYPVVLTIAETPFFAGSTVAFARIQFREALPVRWELATKGNQDVSRLAPDEIFGYGVDSGTGAFMDLVTAKGIDDNYTPYGDLMVELLQQGRTRGEPWATVVVDPNIGANAIAFQSGGGDGFYGSYWGFDADDNVVCLVTDFSVLEDDVDDQE
jgi:hypothetical protein